jgi:hypothetical protein
LLLLLLLLLLLQLPLMAMLLVLVLVLLLLLVLVLVLVMPRSGRTYQLRARLKVALHDYDMYASLQPRRIGPRKTILFPTTSAQSRQTQAG